MILSKQSAVVGVSLFGSFRGIDNAKPKQMYIVQSKTLATHGGKMQKISNI